MVLNLKKIILILIAMKYKSGGKGVQMKSISATRKVGPKKPVMISRGPSINASKTKQKNDQLIDNSSMNDMIL